MPEQRSRRKQTEPLEDREIQTELDRIESNERVLESIIRPGFLIGSAANLEEDPIGWLIADGRYVPKSKYPALFDEIGDRYAQAATEGTFGIPDLRGKGLRGGELREALKRPGNTVAIDTATGSGVDMYVTWLIKT